MDTSIIASIIILVLVILSGAAIFLVKHSKNKKLLEITEKIKTATPEILDIIDKLLANVDSVSDYETLEDFGEAILDKSVDEALQYLKENASKYDIPQEVVDTLTSERMHRLIENIINEFMYGSNIQTVFERFKELETTEMDENKSSSIIDFKTKQTDISEQVQQFYDNGTDI